MRKYVDLDELKENICKRVNNPVIRGWLNRLINETPAADLVEIKHGEWISDDADVLFHCSKCEAQISIFWDYEDLNWNYCPDCGAKMDGERRENER